MSVHVIDTIKPKNNGTFPVVEAPDVKVSNTKRLDAALNDKANQSDLTALQTTVAGKASQADLTALSETVSGKQNSLTEAQLTACNSGITSELVTQIGTNTTAIAGKASQSDLETTNAAVATKANASDVATETASLQAQIDAIVTPVTQDAEVEAARVGTDGTSYASLKSRLDAENTKLTNGLSDTNNVVANYMKVKSATYTQSGYNSFSGFKLINGKSYIIKNTGASTAVILCKPDNTQLLTVYANTFKRYTYTGADTNIKFYCNSNVEVTVEVTELGTTKDIVDSINSSIDLQTIEFKKSFAFSGGYHTCDFNLKNGVKYKVVNLDTEYAVTLYYCNDGATNGTEIATVQANSSYTFEASKDSNYFRVYSSNCNITIEKLDTMYVAVEEIAERVPFIGSNSSQIYNSTEYINDGNNWLDLSKVDNNNVSDYIPVRSGEVIRCAYINTPLSSRKYNDILANQPMRYVIFYDENKKRVSVTSDWVNDVVIPNGIWYIKVDLGSDPTGKSYIILKNAYQNLYRPYSDATMQNYVDAVLPAKLYSTVGQELNIYYENLVIGNKNSISRYGIATSSGSFGGETYGNRLIWKPDEAADINASFVLFGKSTWQPMVKKSVELICSESHSSADIKVLVIGDSKIDNGKPTDYFRTIFGGNVTLLGTRYGAANVDDETNRHEGRSGWSTTDYAMEASKGGLSNPFYNASYTEATYGTHFDFSTYMATQEYEGVDYVFLMLGTNDGTYDACIDLYKGMINSIHEYDSNIKIIIGLNEGAYKGKWFTRNCFYLYQNQRKIEEFDGTMENVYVLGHYLNLDLDNDYDLENVPLSQADAVLETGKTRKYTSDGIHQNSVGSYKMAQCMVGIIDYLLGS